MPPFELILLVVPQVTDPSSSDPLWSLVASNRKARQPDVSYYQKPVKSMVPMYPRVIAKPIKRVQSKSTSTDTHWCRFGT